MLLKTADHTVDSFGIVYIGGFRDLKGETKSVYMIGADQFADLFDKNFRFFKMQGGIIFLESRLATFAQESTVSGEIFASGIKQIPEFVRKKLTW